MLCANVPASLRYEPLLSKTNARVFVAELMETVEALENVIRKRNREKKSRRQAPSPKYETRSMKPETLSQSSVIRNSWFVWRDYCANQRVRGMNGEARDSGRR